MINTTVFTLKTAFSIYIPLGVIYTGLALAEHFHCGTGIKSSLIMFINSVKNLTRTYAWCPCTKHTNKAGRLKTSKQRRTSNEIKPPFAIQPLLFLGIVKQLQPRVRLPWGASEILSSEVWNK